MNNLMVPWKKTSDIVSAVIFLICLMCVDFFLWLTDATAGVFWMSLFIALMVYGMIKMFLLTPVCSEIDFGNKVVTQYYKYLFFMKRRAVSFPLSSFKSVQSHLYYAGKRYNHALVFKSASDDTVLTLTEFTPHSWLRNTFENIDSAEYKQLRQIISVSSTLVDAGFDGVHETKGKPFKCATLVRGVST
jgi:hypothetical protein